MNSSSWRELACVILAGACVLVIFADVLAGDPSCQKSTCQRCKTHCSGKGRHATRREERLESRNENLVFDSRVPVIPLVDSVPLVSSPVVMTNAQYTARRMDSHAFSGWSADNQSLDRFGALEQRVETLESNMQALTESIEIVKEILENHVKKTCEDVHRGE
jgi:hypothetical protein